ncbi:hypothetical protein L873DRAFT_1798614 [Choiromyces venosus 120613-1]|uniref:Uncharacterized protein n=1 Tax=Choiromyces venosus 120613-1 TaxID=1336337 RepID=A0A3N4K2I7_9PEZI|nr:hypothetical protein L873DRAFT_1798614 [Choiromyces venosus 120613-1]
MVRCMQCADWFSLLVYAVKTVSLGLSETVKLGARNAKPVLERFELCDLLRIFKLTQELSHLDTENSEKSNFLTENS